MTTLFFVALVTKDKFSWLLFSFWLLWSLCPCTLYTLQNFTRWNDQRQMSSWVLSSRSSAPQLVESIQCSSTKCRRKHSCFNDECRSVFSFNGLSCRTSLWVLIFDTAKCCRGGTDISRSNFVLFSTDFKDKKIEIVNVLEFNYHISCKRY